MGPLMKKINKGQMLYFALWLRSARNVRDVDRQRALKAERLEDRVEGVEDVVRHEIATVAHAVLHLVRMGGGGGVRRAHEALGLVGSHVGGGEGVDGAVGAHGRCGRRERPGATRAAGHGA